MSAIVQYVSLQDSNITGVIGYATYSVDAGNNTNWVISSTVPISGLDYLYIQDSNATPPYWLAGEHSVNGGNNTGWLFFSNRAVAEDSVFADIEDAQVQFNSFAVEPFSTQNTQAAQVNFNSTAVEDSELLDEAFTSNNTFNSATTENSILDNTQATANGIFNSAVVEPATLAESEIGVAIFAGVITEDAVYDDSQTAQVNFNSIILENSTILDIPISQNSVFSSSIVENLVIVDGQIPRGWFKINDTQDANWTPINNTSG